MKFRKRPIVVEAQRFDGKAPFPAGVCECEVELWPNADGPHTHGPHVHTIEGPLIVSLGDWIITGVKGERYPCKPDVFALTYEPAE